MREKAGLSEALDDRRRRMTGDAGAAGVAAGRLPLSAQLSQALVAFAIEVDNEFERGMPHRTTKHGSAPGLDHLPFLVSMTMWVNCMRLVPGDGIPAGELARRAQITGESMRGTLTRMSEWWGYLAVAPGPAAGPKTPRSAWLVRPTEAGRRAQAVWGPLEREIEDRWRSRLGGPEVDALRGALWGVADQLDVQLPDHLPAGDPRLDPRPPARAAAPPRICRCRPYCRRCWPRSRSTSPASQILTWASIRRAG
jgi:hypothetical protein